MAVQPARTRVPVEVLQGTPRHAHEPTAYHRNMLIAFSVAPSASESESRGSVSEAVAAAVRIVRDSGLPNHTDSMFTTLEGTWEECMEVVRRACDAAGAFGPRVSLVLKADIRPGFEGELTAKVERLERVLDRQRSS
jgi:uncharacterized protein YqgV (UPF0045/DUF77 family)